MIVIDMFCHLEREPTLSQYQYLARIIASLFFRNMEITQTITLRLDIYML